MVRECSVNLGVREMYRVAMQEQRSASAVDQSASHENPFMEIPALIHGHNTIKTNALHKELSALL